MFGAHIIEKQFFAMQKIEDLEWREYLAYNIIYGYIRYNEPKSYGTLEFIVGFWVRVVCIDILLQIRI